jgi:hypothetical protein
LTKLIDQTLFYAVLMHQNSNRGFLLVEMVASFIG